jgi:sulfite reductase beta subunit-like hemoprotein
MAKVIWVGTIEFSYLDHEDSDKRKNAFTVVTTWAIGAEEFRRKCELMLESYGWKLLGIDRANPPQRTTTTTRRSPTNWKGLESIQMPLFMGRSTRTR